MLFLGAMVSAPSPPSSRFVYCDGPPSGSALCQRLVKTFGYRGEDATNLARVSLYAEYGEKGWHARSRGTWGAVGWVCNIRWQQAG